MGGSGDKESSCKAGDLGPIPGEEHPLEEGMVTVFLPGESHGQRSLAGYSSWGRKESDTTEQLNDNKSKACRIRVYSF